MTDIRYVHYFRESENSVFKKEKIEKIQNKPYWNKPRGGFWASRVGSVFDWKDWCKLEDFVDCKEDYAFYFMLKNDAHIIQIESCFDIENKLPLIMKVGHGIFGSEYYIDFEKCVQNGIDGIELFLYRENKKYNPSLYWGLYGWDCDSILILNPDIIIPEKKGGDLI